jgi:hypothetical protein
MTDHDRHCRRDLLPHLERRRRPHAWCHPPGASCRRLAAQRGLESPGCSSTTTSPPSPAPADPPTSSCWPSLPRELSLPSSRGMATGSTARPANSRTPRRHRGHRRHRGDRDLRSDRSHHRDRTDAGPHQGRHLPLRIRTPDRADHGRARLPRRRPAAGRAAPAPTATTSTATITAGRCATGGRWSSPPRPTS